MCKVAHVQSMYREGSSSAVHMEFEQIGRGNSQGARLLLVLGRWCGGVGEA